MQQQQQPSRFTARQLGAVNDSACSLIVDPYLGINVPKIHYRPPVKNQTHFKQIVQLLVDGKKSEDQALKLLLKQEQTKRKIRQMTEFLSLDEQQIAGYFKLYLAAFRNAPSFRLQSYYDDLIGGQGLRVVATRSFKENDIIPALLGVVASTTATAPEQTPPANKKTDTRQQQQEEFLLLGPVAFVNHCFRANTTFRRAKGGDKVVLEVVRQIQAGDEITVSYGPQAAPDEATHCECPKCIRSASEKNKSN